MAEPDDEDGEAKWSDGSGEGRLAAARVEGSLTEGLEELGNGRQRRGGSNTGRLEVAGSSAGKLDFVLIQPDLVTDGARMRRTPASLLQNEAAMAGHAHVRPEETERGLEVREREEPGEEGEGGDKELQRGRPWSTGARRRASGRQEASGGLGHDQHEQRSRPETDEVGGDRSCKAMARGCSCGQRN